jgi:hypothetical protein
LSLVWKRDDDFATSPVVGDRVVGYLPMVPDSSVWSYGLLADFDGDRNPSAHGEDPGNPSLPCAYLWRGAERQDVIARATISHRTDLNVNAVTQIQRSAVFVRVQGGSLTGGGTIDQRLTGVSCYAFTLSGTLNTSFTFALEKYVSGVKQANLGSLTLPIATIPTALFDGSIPFTLTLSAVDSGGSVDLVATIQDFGGAGTPAPGSSFTAFTVTDSSSPLLGAGRVGFGVSQDYTDTSLGIPIYGADKVHRFRYRDFAGSIEGTVYHDDDWTRTSAYSRGLEITDDAGTTARCPMGVFGGDLYTAAPPGFGGSYDQTVLRHGSSSANRADLTWPSSGGTGTVLQYLLAQRPATNGAIQHPEVTLQCVSYTGTSPFAGPIARASGEIGSSGSSNGTLQGYAARLYFNGSAKARIIRYEGNGTARTIGDTVLTPTTFTDYRVGVKVQPFGDDPEGPQLIQLLVNGVSQTMETYDFITGIDYDATTGGIIDSSSLRILSGDEGIVAAFSGTTSAVIELDDWTEGTKAATDPEPKDFATISLGDEGTPTGTLDFWTVQIKAPVSTVQGWQVDEGTFESGHTYARTRFATKRRVWRSLETVPLGVSEKDSLVAFWQARQAGEVPFTWTNPEDQVAYSVRFTTDQLEAVEIFRDVWTVSFGLEEVI